MLKNKILGSIFGHIIGDSAGLPYEFVDKCSLPDEIIWTEYGPHAKPKGTFSDDSSMLLCLIANIVEKGKFDPEDLGKKFVQWLDEGYMACEEETFGTGRTTRKALKQIREGIPALEAGLKEEKDNGNGSLMRILPMALFYYRLLDGNYSDIFQFFNLVEQCSKITHAHARTILVCQYYCFVVGHLILGEEHILNKYDNYFAGSRVVDYKNDLSLFEKIKRIFDLEYYHVCRSFNLPHNQDELDKVFNPDKSYIKYGSGYSVDSLHIALDSVQNANNFVDSVTEAIKHGFDTDTNACVTGGISGFIYGYGSIPKEWLNDLLLTQEQKDLISKFVDMCG